MRGAIFFVLVAVFWAPVLFLWPAPAWAVNPEEMLTDPVLEMHARDNKGLFGSD